VAVVGLVAGGVTAGFDRPAPAALHGAPAAPAAKATVAPSSLGEVVGAALATRATPTGAALGAHLGTSAAAADEDASVH